MNNYHTHTCFCDGRDTPEELILEAIKLGCTELGFSGHSHLPFDNSCMSKQGTLDYCLEVRRLQAKYASQICIKLGIEQDIFSEIDRNKYDYVIGAVHYIQKAGKFFPVDYSCDSFLQIVQEIYNGDFYTLAEDYYQLESEVWERTQCDIIAHFDLITKYNEGDCLFDTSHPRYLAAADAALEKLMKTPAILEINTGAMARGYRKTPYPQDIFLKKWKASGKKIIWSSDCHDKRYLLYGFEEESNI